MPAAGGTPSVRYVVLPVARIGAISANIAACTSVIGAPSRASAAAGAVSSASGIVPNRSTAVASPAGMPVHAAGGGAGAEDLDRVAEGDLDVEQRGAVGRVGAPARAR